MVELDVNKENEEEPDFSDPEDFVDDIADEGKRWRVRSMFHLKLRSS